MTAPAYQFVSSQNPLASSISSFVNTYGDHRQCRALKPRSMLPPERHVTGVRAVIPGTELVRPQPSSLLSNGPLKPSQVATFFEQGYIVVQSLVPPHLVTAMREAIPAVEAAQTARNAVLYNTLAFRVWNSHPIFKQIATSSPVAAAAAQLCPVNNSSRPQRSLVVLRDAYFRMQGKNKGCGFHVDDRFFWPCPVDAPGPGVNAWIALHDVNEDGGGLTVAPGSHVQSFVDCREAIKDSTCQMAELDPEKNARLERIAVSPIMKAGDVILHTRWLFHRGNPFKSGSKGESGEGIGRYSVRYMPGESEVNELLFDGGEVVTRPPVLLKDADELSFPAVSLDSL
ncbi:unnamed protein product [Agarophyton chilense]|eukprot:gb/GEZJ01002587.1/.p1 GENE.gb/GEZJ01002587.1/~~gb/GEZJ01002587.1/.p1  ORF type:complete len:342 (-),score=29.61 gb/GEZJ01002587.1/:1283-2308(-)